MLFTGSRLPLIAFGLALFNSGCLGEIGSSAQIPDSNDAHRNPNPAPRNPDRERMGEPSGDPEMISTPSVAFRPPVDSLQLLPFEARLTKLANVLGAKTNDAVFSELGAQRRELGAYDFAQGISPDLSWSAKRISGWMKAIRPVCDAPAMKRRYPTITGELEVLVMSAHGRKATEDDRSDLASVPNSLDSTARYRAMCMGFLASAEFLTP